MLPTALSTSDNETTNVSTNPLTQPNKVNWSKIVSKKKTQGSGGKSLKTKKMKAPDLRVGQADGRIKHLILDAGAFISRKPFYESLQADVKYWTTNAVLREIRDRESRRFIDSFPFKLNTKQVSREAMNFAKEFCQLTKDLASLSGPDLEIVALSYMLEKEVHGLDNINPIPLQRDFQADIVDKHNARVSPIKRNSNVPLIQRRTIKQLKMDDFFNQEPPPRSHDGPQEIARKRTRILKSKQKEEKPDEEDCGIPWITEDNLHLLSDSSMMIKKKDNRDKNPSTVGVITTDYQIQNALYQIGIRILSVNGMSIYQIREWALHCYACF
jgi:RNA-binding protein NOB1